MSITVSDYGNVRERATALGCTVSSNFVLLPDNFISAGSPSDFLQPSESATVRTLFKNNSIPFDNLQVSAENPAYIQNNGFEWVSPAIFISYSLLSQNPDLVSLALNVMASYIFDFFKGVPGDNKVKLEFIVENGKDYTCKTLKYEGDISGIISLKDTIQRISNE